MGTLSAANDCPLSSKWVPCLLQMTTLSATFQMPTLFPVNGYPLCQISNDSLSLSAEYNFPSFFAVFYGQLVRLVLVRYRAQLSTHQQARG